MNLHSIVAGGIGVINPFVPCKLQINRGYTTAIDGTRSPVYDAAVTVMCQIQPLQSLQFGDLQRLDGLNLQGERRAVYLKGRWEGEIRFDNKGSDLITLPDGSVWLIAIIIEAWPTWTRMAIVRQDGA